MFFSSQNEEKKYIENVLKQKYMQKHFFDMLPWSYFNKVSLAQMLFYDPREIYFML